MVTITMYSMKGRKNPFYGKPLDEIALIESEEIDWGRTEGSEVW